jgi:hypothetical protein
MRFLLMFAIGIGMLVCESQLRLAGSFDKAFKSTAVSKAELQLRGGVGSNWGYAGSDCLSGTSSCPQGPKPRDVALPPTAVIGTACTNGPWCNDLTPSKTCKTIYYIYFDTECSMAAPYSCLGRPGIVEARSGIGSGSGFTRVCAANGAPVGGACGTVTTCTN